ncbi:hypothetical protein ACWD3I_46065 [Streptomyces sp. NPDC002817]
MRPILGSGFTEKVVQTVNSTQPELIAVVGDPVDGAVDDLRSAVEPISGLQARHGAFFVATRNISSPRRAVARLLDALALGLQTVPLGTVDDATPLRDLVLIRIAHDDASFGHDSLNEFGGLRASCTSDRALAVGHRTSRCLSS